VFSFFHKNPRSVKSLESLGCDLHSHLIPGIDDGVQDIASSLELIRGLMDLGYKKIITTPHVNGESYPNTPDTIGAGKAAVLDALRREGIEVEFRAAAEYLIDDEFTETLAAGGSFLTLKDNFILVELSFAVPAINLRNILFDLQLKGYVPVLAHPERYLYFGANKGWYDQLRDAGCLFQLNLLSFIGHYGPEALQLANYLIKKKYVEFLGTDMHHHKHLELIRSSPAIFRTVDKLVETGLIRNPQL
jgi:protein-tyrosine phosphatase